MTTTANNRSATVPASTPNRAGSSILSRQTLIEIRQVGAPCGDHQPARERQNPAPRRVDTVLPHRAPQTPTLVRATVCGGQHTLIEGVLHTEIIGSDFLHDHRELGVLTSPVHTLILIGHGLGDVAGRVAARHRIQSTAQQTHRLRNAQPTDLTELSPRQHQLLLLLLLAGRRIDTSDRGPAVAALTVRDQTSHRIRVTGDDRTEPVTGLRSDLDLERDELTGGQHLNEVRVPNTRRLTSVEGLLHARVSGRNERFIGGHRTLGNTRNFRAGAPYAAGTNTGLVAVAAELPADSRGRQELANLIGVLPVEQPDLTLGQHAETLRLRHQNSVRDQRSMQQIVRRRQVPSTQRIEHDRKSPQTNALAGTGRSQDHARPVCDTVIPVQQTRIDHLRHPLGSRRLLTAVEPLRGLTEQHHAVQRHELQQLLITRSTHPTVTLAAFPRPRTQRPSRSPITALTMPTRELNLHRSSINQVLRNHLRHRRTLPTITSLPKSFTTMTTLHTSQTRQPAITIQIRH
ncbi:hypothetical protein UG54_01275 [Gordonia sihwensis]|nr:hypothetical protein UG54_01275 [Gordonia sihwensis]